MFTSVQEALGVLHNPDLPELRREEAAAYLEHHVEPGAGENVVSALVKGLRDEDLGVRWATAEALVRLGTDALPELLATLTDPKGAGDVRVRDAARHILLHMVHAGYVSSEAGALLAALRGPASDLATMEVAGHWLQRLRSGAQAHESS